MPSITATTFIASEWLQTSATLANHGMIFRLACPSHAFSGARRCFNAMARKGVPSAERKPPPNAPPFQGGSFDRWASDGVGATRKEGTSG